VALLVCGTADLLLLLLVVVVVVMAGLVVLPTTTAGAPGVVPADVAGAGVDGDIARCVACIHSGSPGRWSDHTLLSSLTKGA
jgi:hypothetical protein